MATILMTGGHGSFGLACSRVLAAEAHVHLILAGRSPAQMDAVARELRSRYGVEVTILPLDLASLESVRIAAAKCRQMLHEGSIDPLQAIICNAGEYTYHFASSQDGFERTFAVNYLAHFLLVKLLLDCVSESGRIVLTGSASHDPTSPEGKMVGGTNDADAKTLAFMRNGDAKEAKPGARYANSKVCTMLFAYELARRLEKSGSGVASIAFDPGFIIAGSRLSREAPKAARPLLWLLGTPLGKWISQRLGIKVGEVASSGLRLAQLAVDPAFGESSGKYFQCQEGRLIERRSSALSYNKQCAQKLWEDSLQLAGLPAEPEST